MFQVFSEMGVCVSFYISRGHYWIVDPEKESIMRMPRIKESTGAYYHLISRIIQRQRLLNSTERQRFCEIMRAAEGFSGIRILTYAVLSNHVHILLYVPERRQISDEEFAQRLGYLYGPDKADAITESLVCLRQNGDWKAAEKLKGRYTSRMHDLSEFGKTLKQKVTQSYNRRHRRKGTLWEERFKSILIEGTGHVLSTVAAYIDLNAVRARIVSDPCKYRFCGYGEAMGGSVAAREGIGEVMAQWGQSQGWGKVAARYRKCLYLQGQVSKEGLAGTADRPGFSPEQVQAVLEQGGELPLGELLRCRVRYFSDGVVLGGKAYVEDAITRHRRQFTAVRKHRARRMRGGHWGELCTARHLRVDVITVPATG